MRNTRAEAVEAERQKVLGICEEYVARMERDGVVVLKYGAMYFPAVAERLKAAGDCSYERDGSLRALRK